MNPSTEELHAMLIGLIVAGLATFALIFVFVWAYDRRRYKRETQKLRAWADENGVRR